MWIEISDYPEVVNWRILSPPTRVVWIEIDSEIIHINGVKSPPTRVVWIEILKPVKISFSHLSPPTRVVWIEINDDNQASITYDASPPTRVVWIEIL